MWAHVAIARKDLAHPNPRPRRFFLTVRILLGKLPRPFRKDQTCPAPSLRLLPRSAGRTRRIRAGGMLGRFSQEKALADDLKGKAGSSNASRMNPAEKHSRKIVLRGRW